MGNEGEGHPHQRKNKMDIFEKAYGYNEDLAKGKWFPVNEIQVKLAYLNDPKIEAKVHDLRAQKAEKTGRQLTNDEHEEIGTAVFVSDVLLDWKTDIPCNQENKIEVMKKYPRFVTDCMTVAGNNKCFQEKQIEEATGK